MNYATQHSSVVPQRRDEELQGFIVSVHCHLRRCPPATPDRRFIARGRNDRRENHFWIIAPAVSSCKTQLNKEEIMVRVTQRRQFPFVRVAAALLLAALTILGAGIGV